MANDDSFPTEPENPVDLSENKKTTALDILQNMDAETIDIIKPDEPVACGGPECEAFTTRPSGMCADCEKKYEPLLRATLMKCTVCPAKSSCKYARNELGICVVEMQDEDASLDTKEDLERIMQDVINTDKLMFDRMKRYTASQNPLATDSHFTSFSRDLQSYGKVLMEHMKHYAAFRGWTKTRVDKEMLNLKSKVFKKVIGNEKKKGTFRANDVDDNLEPRKVVNVSVPQAPEKEGKAFTTDEEAYEFPDADDLDQMLVDDDVDMDKDLMELEELEAMYSGQKGMDDSEDDTSEDGEEDDEVEE